MGPGDAEATSLMRWLGFYATDGQEDCVTIVLRLLELAFSAVFEDQKALNGWNAVVTVLEGFYETSLAVDVERLNDSSAELLSGTLRTLLELVLAALVQCETKETFVKDILTMEDAVQADLMAIIEKVMARGVSILTEESSERPKGEEKKEKNAMESPGMGSPLYLSRNAALERTKRENGVLKEENVHLARQLEVATTKCGELEDEKKLLVGTIRQLKQQVDADALRQERSMRALYDERIQTLQHELSAAKAELLDKTVLANQVPMLQDEVDLLRPLAEKMAKMDTTVAKYKAKIDEMSGAKESLRRLEGTNAELIERNLVLESELAKAASWKRKLKEAKEANTAAEFRISELEALIARERKEFATVRAELETTQVALQETKALIAQLQESFGQQSSNDSESCSASAMSGGISEFNPELMQKLARMEYENAELKKQIDGETSARIDSLLDEIDDLTRLKKSFETKYFESEQAHQSTQTELKSTKDHLECLIAELQTQIHVAAEWKLCLEEDVSSHALEYQTLIEERDHLADELCRSNEQEHQLTQLLASRHRELTELHEVNQLLTERYDQLAQQHEYLARVKDDLEERLVQQIACTGMQLEDANAERIRFHECKARELSQVCRRYDEQVADTISRLTSLVDIKSAEIEQLTSKFQVYKIKNETERLELEATNLSTIQELDRYQELHSVSNADWTEKEETLRNRANELEKLCSEYKQQKQTLKATIKSQLQSNARLVEKNKDMKADIVEKRQTMSMLENTVTRLESKVALLEKERAHFTNQEERKRDVESGISQFSSLLSMQVTLLVTELEKVLKESKELDLKLANCDCESRPPRQHGGSDSAQKAKNYYLTRIQQLEHDKQQIDQKRRELLLVNAKLIQEQKQLHVKNVSLANQVYNLQESLNHWRLREERRKKKEDRSSLQLEDKQSSSESSLALTGNQSIANEPLAKLEQHQDSKPTDELLDSKLETESRALASAPTQKESAYSTPVNETRSSNKPTPKSAARRKRRLEDDFTTPETVQPTRCAASATEPDFTDAKDFFSAKSPAQPAAFSSVPSSSERRSKRRLSRFITRNLTSNDQQSERPSECKQQ
ncbi:hypothetical protein PR003_g5626 [Phytophthora rubi]|uniref:Hook C-terminal domain-containing protein n=1 Tax=Phytophthora rubi TaxID=129364 RepID=A0A6A3MYW0_9STRA|nr:hypothetical protein PR002_g10376 [Phytophthora rubi]KAE9033152.1 hypothetical protein PR001_g10288 [Phytophthora rubi]KAE9349912.1 hypothetical protein PR003_g5626 [Phytophthora rubi]